jgi:hypothetical protein
MVWARRWMEVRQSVGVHGSPARVLLISGGDESGGGEVVWDRHDGGVT